MFLISIPFPTKEYIAILKNFLEPIYIARQRVLTLTKFLTFESNPACLNLRKYGRLQNLAARIGALPLLLCLTAQKRPNDTVFANYS